MKKTSKKLLSMALAASMVLSMTACGSKPAETEKVCEETPAEEAAAEVTEEPAKETPIAATVEEDMEGAN